MPYYFCNYVLALSCSLTRCFLPPILPFFPEYLPIIFFCSNPGLNRIHNESWCSQAITFILTRIGWEQEGLHNRSTCRLSCSWAGLKNYNTYSSSGLQYTLDSRGSGAKIKGWRSNPSPIYWTDKEETNVLLASPVFINNFLNTYAKHKGKFHLRSLWNSSFPSGKRAASRAQLLTKLW